MTWTFTDQQSLITLEESSATDCETYVALRGSPVYSVILHKLHENLRRAENLGRDKEASTKLNFGELLCSVWEKEDIYHFNNELGLILNITHLTPSEAAPKIHNHISKTLQGL